MIKFMDHAGRTAKYLNINGEMIYIKDPTPGEEMLAHKGDTMMSNNALGYLSSGYYLPTINRQRINSVTTTGKQYLLTFRSDDTSWGSQTILQDPGNLRVQLYHIFGDLYGGVFTARSNDTGVGIYNNAGKSLAYKDYSLSEYTENPIVATSKNLIKVYRGSQVLWEKPDDSPFKLDLHGFNVVLPTLWDVQDQINSRTQNYREIDRIVIHLKNGNQVTLSDILKDGSSDIRADNVDPSGTRFISNSDIDKVLVYLNT